MFVKEIFIILCREEVGGTFNAIRQTWNR